MIQSKASRGIALAIFCPRELSLCVLDEYGALRSHVRMSANHVTVLVRKFVLFRGTVESVPGRNLSLCFEYSLGQTNQISFTISGDDDKSKIEIGQVLGNSCGLTMEQGCLAVDRGT